MFSFVKRIILAGALITILLPAGYSVARSPSLIDLPPDQVIVKLDGDEITKATLENAMNKLIPLVTYHSSVSTERLKSIEKTALKTLIDEKLIYKYAKSSNQFKVDDKEIDEKIDTLREKLKKGETLEEVLKRSNMDMAELKEVMKADIIVNNVKKQKMDELKKKSEDIVDEAFMKKYYNENLEKFQEPQQVHIREILLKADPSGGQRVWNEVMKKAQDISDKARGGADFAQLAMEFSQDEFAEKGGDLGWAHSGSLMAEIDQVVSNMKPGEVSDPIMSLYGYHVVKLEEVRPSKQKKFEELNRENLEKELEKKEYKNLWSAWLESLRENVKIEYLTDVRDK